ncbi:hypothetical protein [Pedobacter frigoris]|uniref:DUF2971 domain-containing protein n=1 Tax=Pedobacter frigoris TaxID=2571272 RepID=A0A4U1CGH4_9SPHI|nr:hypothetical protein [Pedobacter frigoris]TKC04206.1 hypothetical protein FA047_16540 [Pedobacter frigoris]
MEYFYHYTSVENLALILKHRTLRFKALDTVDDLNEGLTNDVDEYRQFVFVSCWTDQDIESIPIWNMYAKDMSGVRIALPKYPFTHYSFEDLPNEVVSNIPFARSTIVNYLHFDNGYIFHQGEHYLVKVEYTDDIALLKPNLVEPTSEQGKTIWSARIGKFKQNCWDFQSEVRYRIIVYPRGGFKRTETEKFNFESRMKSKHIDVPISEDAFGQMKILLGPKQLDEHSLIVEALIEKYNPGIELQRSILSIRH